MYTKPIYTRRRIHKTEKIEKKSGNTMRELRNDTQEQRGNVLLIYGIIGAFVSLFALSSNAGIFYDNRFFPLTLYPYVTYYDRDCYATIGAFMTTSSSAFERNEREIPLFDIYGKYDQKALAIAMQQAGLGNPFIEAGQEDLLISRSTILWNMNGKIQSQGLYFGAQGTVSKHVTIGFEWYFMRVNSRINFAPEEARDRSGELDLIRRNMNTELGINGNQVDEAGMGDIDLYLRIGNDWDYMFKFRHISLGVRFGLLVPSGKKANIFEPASIPLGGNGHWGFYFMGDGELELKEDWKLGLYIGLSKRLAKTELQRLPINNEPSIFAPIIGDVRVNPGVTFMFAPYFSVENLREGFGARLQYTLSIHGEDSWGDRRCDTSLPVTLKRVIDLSGWSGGHVTLTALYDFGKMKVDHGIEPVVYLAWDVPVNVMSVRRIPKTTKVSLGIEFNF